MAERNIDTAEAALPSSAGLQERDWYTHRRCQETTIRVEIKSPVAKLQRVPLREIWGAPISKEVPEKTMDMRVLLSTIIRSSREDWNLIAGETLHSTFGMDGSEELAHHGGFRILLWIHWRSREHTQPLRNFSRLAATIISHLLVSAFSFAQSILGNSLCSIGYAVHNLVPQNGL
jgi:hypothetical protein